MTFDILACQVDCRIIKGALVDFGPGACVSSFKHPSDYSAIRVSCYVPQRSAADFAIYMFDMFREPVGLPRIHIITAPDACPVIAHVQVKSPSFAIRIKSKFDRYLKCIPTTRISIRVAPVEIHYEASLDPPDMTAISLSLLQDRYTRLRIKEIPVDGECTICLTEAEDPYLTACGHLYCRACFRAQCASVSKDTFPIRCFGNAGKCTRVLLLPELRMALPSGALNQLLATSYAAHLKTIDTIQECPTSHCDQTYRTSTDGSVLTCLKCSTPICTTCQAPSHSGMTCATRQRLGAAEIQSWNLGKDIRKCPRCRNLIEKTGGCERVDCACGAGLCWKCMELWDANRQCRCLRAKWGIKK